MAREIPQPAQRTFRLGRAAFLALSAATIAALIGKRNLPSLNLAPSLASAGGFTIYTVTDGFPKVAPASFRLRVGGLVDHPLEMTLGEILRHPSVTVVDDYHCVTGWTVPNSHWRGIRLSDLLDRVGPHAGAHALMLSSFDGVYTESLTMAQARHPDVLLAYALNGKPLSQAQGAPLRLVVPGMYGYKYIKWLDRVDLVSTPQDGYWEVRGYDRDAYIGHSNFGL